MCIRDRPTPEPPAESRAGVPCRRDAFGMTDRVVDLRSDTITKPVVAMRMAMASAEVGDDVYGEDPTVRALEDRIADLLGHESGLFTPSGSMANQLAIRLHVGPGQELIADELAHVLRAEMGAAAVLSGISSRSWKAPRGLLDPDVPLGLMQTDAGTYQVSTRAIVVENTHLSLIHISEPTRP